VSLAWSVELIGMGAAVLTTGAMLPQALKVWRSKSARDLSLIMYLMFWVGVALWVVYGVAIGSAAVIGSNVSALLMVSLILYFKFRYD
jgi:MtN3 and saliva related transmembrane protein